MGRAGRARVRATDGLRAVDCRVRRGVREGGLVSKVGVGMLGYGFMGKAHSNAYKTLAYMTWPPPLMPELVAIAGRNEEAVEGAARRYGFAEHVTDWKRLVT